MGGRPKGVGILEIYKDQQRFTPLPLATTRQFSMRTVVLQEHGLDPADHAAIELFLVEQVRPPVGVT